MTADDLRNLLTTNPFVPFRLYLTDGKLLDVHHPDFVLIDKRGRMAMIFEAEGPKARTYSSYAQIALLHVTRTEPLETAAPR